jgi:PAS domain-containing protein
MLEPSSQVKTTAAMLQQLRASVNPDLGKLDGLTRAVLHKVSDGILFLDLNGKIVEANESAQKYLGVLDASGSDFGMYSRTIGLGFQCGNLLGTGFVMH